MPAAGLTVLGPVSRAQTLHREYGGQIRVLGLVTEDRLEQVDAEEDVLVMSSLHEGFACPASKPCTNGVPVIATAEGGLRRSCRRRRRCCAGLIRRAGRRAQDMTIPRGDGRPERRGAMGEAL